MVLQSECLSSHNVTTFSSPLRNERQQMAYGAVRGNGVVLSRHRKTCCINAGLAAMAEGLVSPKLQVHPSTRAFMASVRPLGIYVATVGRRHAKRGPMLPNETGLPGVFAIASDQSAGVVSSGSSNLWC